MMDENTFNAAISHFGTLWQRTAWRITGNAADADEAVQLALIAAWRHRGAFRRRSALASWICRIVINQAYNLLRRKRRREERQWEYLRRNEACSGQEREQLILLRECIGRLPRLFRNAMELYLAGDGDAAAAARLAGCPVKTMYCRLQKARQLLKELMEESDHERS